MKDIENLVSQMTLEEKASLCSGQNFWYLKGIERLGIPSIMVEADINEPLPQQVVTRLEAFVEMIA